MRIGDRNCAYISSEMISYYSGMKHEDAKITLLELCDMGYIKKIGRYSYTVDKSAFAMQGNLRYAFVDHTVPRLFKNMKLFRFYCIIVSSINYDRKVGFMPISYFVETYGISKNTIVSYNKKLEEMHLIYIARSQYNGDNRPTNAYGLWENKELVDKYVDTPQVFINKGNEDRSIKQRYNRYMKDPTKYTGEKLQELLSQIRDYNKRHPDKILTTM